MSNPYRILIIEGNAATYLMIARIMNVMGYQVSVASNGNEGIRRAFSEIPHCILLNTILPDGSGFEVCRKLRVSDPQHHHPIILMGSKNTQLDYSWGLKQGCDYYLPIPLKQETVLQAIQYVLSPRFRPPENIQQLIVGRPPELFERATQTLPIDWTLLIPARSEEPDLLTADNPFEAAFIIKDKSARRVYDVIDNHKNVHEICQATGFSAKVVLEALRFLLRGNRIQLRGADGRLVDGASLPPNS